MADEDFDRTGGAEAGAAGLKERFHGFFGAEAAGGFDLDAGTEVPLEELDIGELRACRAEAGGGLDEVRAAFRDAAAGGDFFCFREITGLDDDFEDMWAGNALQCADLFDGSVGSPDLSA